MNRSVLVIGYGNSLRGDDAFGPIVAARLAASPWADRVTILSRHLLTPELAADVRDVSLVIFVDATTDGPVGQVLCRRLAADPETGLSMAHHLEPGGVLRWTSQAYQHEPAAYLVSTRGTTFDFTDAELSPAVATVVPAALERIRTLIEAHFAKAGVGM